MNILAKKRYSTLLMCIFLQSFLPLSLFAQAQNSAAMVLYTAVLEGTHSEKEILALHKSAQEDAYKATDWQKDALLSLSDFSLGMYYYYTSNEAKAGTAFDSGIFFAQKSIEKNENATNTALYASLILHNASVKKLAYQLKWVPKIKGIADSAIGMDKNQTDAYIVSYETECFFPAPYGNYKDGISDMKNLLLKAEPKSDYQNFAIYSAMAYAYGKIGKKKEAKEAYSKALSYFPKNPEALKRLNALQN